MGEAQSLMQQLIEVKAMAFDTRVHLEQTQAANQQLQNIVTEVAKIAGVEVVQGKIVVENLLDTLKAKFVSEAEPATVATEAN